MSNVSGRVLTLLNNVGGKQANLETLEMIAGEIKLWDFREAQIFLAGLALMAVPFNHFSKEIRQEQRRRTSALT